jgi:isocitrate dehydrogenase (NAD+)
MANRIDARMKAAQPIRFEPPKDCLPAEAEPDQLRPRNHAVLPAGQGRERSIPRVWAPICTICVTVGAHTARVADRVRPVGYVRNSLATMARSKPIERTVLTHRVTFIPGDGTGPELAEATRRVLEATGVEFEWDFQDAGIDVYEQEGNPLPDRTLDSIRERGTAIKGPTTTPVGSGHRSINVALRKEFDLYCCLRPCKAYEGVRTRYPETDIVIVRENTEDLYAGIEFEKGSAEVEKLRTFLADELDSPTRDESGISIKPISVFGSERIVESAFQYAKDNGRKKVTAAHKANIMKFSDGLFLEVARQVAERHPEIEFEDRIIDNLCNQLVSRPEEYDVVVLPNLYGDIVSDLAAGMIGGLGLAPGANIGSTGAIFEATHGSAPKYKGQNRVNPTALLLSGVLMLRHLGETEASERMESGIAEVIRKGDKVTYDLKPTRDDPSAVGTSEFADAVIEEMNA